MMDDSQDRIEITGLRLPALIGILQHERQHRQDVIVHLTLFTDTKTAARSDAIADTIDYSKVTDRVAEFVKASEFFLLERLAEEISDLVLRDFPVPKLQLRIEKPDAIPVADTIALTITRERR